LNPFIHNLKLIPMAKKTAESPTIATQKTSKSRTEPRPHFPSALRYFWDFADLSWKYANDHQETLAARRPLFNKEYIAAQVAYIAEVKAMPNNDVRTSQRKKSRLSLSGHRQAIMTEVNLLDGAIRLAYEAQAELVPVELRESGITALRSATPRDWAAVSTFLTTATAYLQANGQKLVDAGAITDKFASDLAAKGNEFNAAKAEFTDKKQSAKEGTASVAQGVKKIKTAISAMQDLGKNVFEFQPELRKLFTADYVLNEVRSKHPAHIVGRTDLGPVMEGMKAKPLAGILVEVLGQTGKTATTDAEGRYKIPIAGGEYMVQYTGDGMSPITMKVVVSPGVDRRVNVVLEPAPQPAERTAQAPPHIPATSLADAVSGLLDKAAATNGVQEGAAA
jgi:hypothetical protein